MPGSVTYLTLLPFPEPQLVLTRAFKGQAHP
jgi:hypothetical protein